MGHLGAFGDRATDCNGDQVAGLVRAQQAAVAQVGTRQVGEFQIGPPHQGAAQVGPGQVGGGEVGTRSEEHTSELQSLMRISYAVFCLKKKKSTNDNNHPQINTHKNKENKTTTKINRNIKKTTRE